MAEKRFHLLVGSRVMEPIKQSGEGVAVQTIDGYTPGVIQS
ncbi:MAG: hypothetical protein VX712_00385 [Bacteroidota bacterium]|nr:hypothetical protein [Bacteroidota bacterium]